MAEFKVGDEVYLFDSYLRDIPLVQGPVRIKSISPKRGHITLETGARLSATGCGIGSFSKQSIQRADAPGVAAQVLDIQRRHSLRRIQAALGFKDSIKTVSDGLRRAEAIVAACKKHLEKWPEDNND